MKYTYNTKEKGVFYFLILKDKDNDDFIAVCLNLDIVEYGKNPETLKESITEAAFSYLEAVRAKNLSDDNLNKFAPDKYLNSFLDEVDILERTVSKSPKPKKKESVKPDYFEYTKHSYPYNFV